MRNILVIIAPLLLTNCGATQGDYGHAAVTTASVQGVDSYRLMPGDKLKVEVFNEPDLQGEFQINENGKIAFPLLGELQAGGLTVEQFDTALTEGLGDGFLQNPRVNVDIVNYRPINIVGEVKNAGQYPYRPGISAQDAIAIAGGYTYRANSDFIYVNRAKVAEEIKVSMDNGRFAVLPGDSIRVPERYF